MVRATRSPTDAHGRNPGRRHRPAEQRGYQFEAYVTEKNGGELAIEPISRGISYRTARAREITAHWARRARATNRT
jgi:hypothetical protein